MFVLTKNQADALTRLRNGQAWDYGKSRGGGSTSRMFSRLVEAGLIEGPPYKITKKGRDTLASYIRLSTITARD